MRLHLPLVLLTALLTSFPLAQTLRAETLFATGASEQLLTESSRFSDTGKGCYFNESYNYYQPYKGAGELYEETGSWDFMGSQLAPSINAGSGSVSGALGGLTHDVSMCWANATANVMQYWESYYGIFYDGANGELPYGWNYDPELAETLGGSQSLTIYNEFYRHWFDEGGTFKWASDWYCRRVDPSKLYIKDEGTGGWWENWFGESHAYVINYYDGNSNIDTLTRNFAAALGYTAQEDGSWAQTTVGQIGYLGISSYLGGHALTCWGMELGEDNRVKAIYITNSDDLTYQLVKLYIKSEGGQYYLFNDEACTEFWNWNAANWYLDEVSYMNTPQALKDLYREYSGATLTWTGAAAEWSEANSADRRIGYALPGSDAGWSLTMREKSYDSYFDANRNLRFDDSAAATDIRTGGQLAAGAVALANSGKSYTFTAGAGGCSLTAESLTATTGGSAVFRGMDIAAGSLMMDGYSLSVQDGSLAAATATLQGGASLTLGNSTAAFGDLSLGNGTVLTLDLSRAGDECALISVSGNMVTAGGLTLNVHNLPTDLSELYMVISAGSYDASLWNSTTVTLNGTTSDLLFWRDGVLYYGSYVDKQHLYFTAHTEAPEKWRKFEGLSFTGIQYKGDGAALTSAQELRLEKNGPVLFEGNSATGSGGALFNSATFSATGNKSLSFRGNSAAETGGALANAGGSVTITGSQSVTFEDNAALAGGALAQSGGSISVSGNGSVLFSGNGAVESGGAVRQEGGTMQLADNDSLSFCGNHAEANGGAVDNAGGTFVISGNGSTAFTDNRAGGLGGAVYNAYDGRVIIKADAGDVVFRGNAQGSGGNTVLRAVHSQGDLHSDDLKENISAAEGHSVVFYDAVRVENTAWYGQTNLNTEGSGSIVFSGRYAAEDLQRLTGSTPGEAALRESRSSVFTGSIYLAGGTLRIEDGASVTADSLYTADGAVPVTIALSNGALHTPDYSLAFGTNKTLELSGVNTVESSYIAFFSDSTLTFNLSAVHADTAALTLITPDRFDMQGSLTLNLNGTEALEGGLYKLIETGHGVLWDCSLTLNGGYAEALKWENGTLWYDADYEPIIVPSTDLVFTETLSGSFAYSGNDSLTFTTGNARAIDESGDSPAEVLLSENGALSFSGMSVEGSGGAVANVSHGKDAPSLIEVQGNGPIEFSGIKATDDGGLIANTSLNGGEARIDFLGNDTISLLNGTASAGRGGALFNTGVVNMSGNGEISLGDNAADKDGGAVYNAAGATLNICENAGLSLSRNTTEGRGGAVANYGELHLDDNNFVTASGNNSLYGAALYNEGLLSMAGNGYVQFAGNDCVKHGADYSDFGLGGNICNSEEGEIRICDNGSVSLSSAYALFGGGIYNEGSLIIENNLDVNMDSDSVEQNGGALFNIGGTFSLSHNRNVTFNEDWAWGGYGGAICNMTGTVDVNDNASLAVFSSYCALSNGNTSASGEAVMNIIGNGDIIFYDNIAYQTKEKFNGKAGAVYNHANGTLNICGNGDVEFHNNTVLMFAEVSPTGKDGSYLHALHNEGTLNLSAKGGKSIVFYDGISSAKGSVVNLNKEYTDIDGKVQNAAGDIVFSGVRVESTLYSNMLAEFVTPELIAKSKTSTLETAVNLCGGRLSIEADARLSADALTALAGSGSTVHVEDAELNVKGALTLQSGTKLETEGVNRIGAGSVNLLSGSTLSFVLSSTNLTESVLSLTGSLNTENISVSLGDTSYLEKGNTYALLSATDYKTDAWTAENISIATEGVLFDDLEWSNGTLYLHYVGHVVPLTVTWSNASGDGLWNAASLNWLQKETAAAYADEMKVVFGDKGAGKVTPVGSLSPKSVLVDSAYDYDFAGKGKLSGSMTLTKQGSGTLRISTANDYTGGTVINGGTVVAGNAAALGSGAVSVNNATLEIAAEGVSDTLSFAGKSALVVDAGYQLVLSGALNNSGTLTVSGAFNAEALKMNTTAATHVDVSGNSGASGFAKDAVYSVQLVNGGTVVNNGATVTHGSHTLTLGSNGVASSGGSIHYDTYLLTGNAAATTSAIHGKSSTATITQTGGTLTVNDTATVTATGGSVMLSGGTLNGTLSGTSITATGGTLAATLNGANTLNGSSYALKNVIANNGTLTIGGTLDASALKLNTTAATHVDVNGASGASGFAKDTAYSVQLVNGGTVVNNGATVTHGSHNLTLGSNGVASAGGAVDYSTYLLTGNAAVATSAIHAKSSTAVVSMNGGTLTVNDAAIVHAVGGSLTLDGGSLTGTVQTAAGSELTLKSSAALNGDLTLDGGSLALNGNTLAVSDTLRLLSTTSFDVSAYGIGSYQLLTFGELVGSLDNLSIDSKRYRYALTQENNALMLTVKALNNTLTWNAAKGTWATNGAFGSGVFREDDDVIFRTAATVTVSGAVKPGDVLVDSSANVTFTADKKVAGSGMAGSASVTKSGAGMLTLNAGNTYSGGTVLNAGTIKATAADSFGTGDITVNGGTLDLGSKAVANDIVLTGAATIKGDAKYAGSVTVNGDATLLAKTSYKGLTTIGAGSSLTLAEKATMAGSIAVDGGAFTITAPKGLTLAKNTSLSLDKGGTVNGLLTVGAGSTLVWSDGIFATAAPTLNGGALNLGGAGSLTLTGSKAEVQFGDKSVYLPGKGIVQTADELCINSGTVTVNAMGNYSDAIIVNGGTLKLATGKTATYNTIIVNGNAAVANGTTHYGDIIVNGTLAKGTAIKLLSADRKVELNGSGTMLGTISGTGRVEVRGDVDITAGGKLSNTDILLTGTLTHTKGWTLAKGQTLTLNGGAVNGALNIGSGAVLAMNGHTLSAAPVLKGGTADFGGSCTLALTGSKGDISIEDQNFSLLSKSFVKSNGALTVHGGTVTVNDFGGSKEDITVKGGTLKLSTGKLTSDNRIIVSGNAAVSNGTTHYGDIIVNGTLAKGTAIKLLSNGQKVQLNGAGPLLGSISGAGTVEVNASIDASTATLMAANIVLNHGSYTTKGIKLAKGQTLSLNGASLNLGTKGVLSTAAGSTLAVNSNTSISGSLTLGGGELVFNGSALDVQGTLTLSKAMTVTGSGIITYDTLKAAKNVDVEKLFGAGAVLDTVHGTLTFGDYLPMAAVAPASVEPELTAAAEAALSSDTATAATEPATAALAAAPQKQEAETVATPAPLSLPAVNPVADAFVQSDWAVLETERAFTGSIRNRSMGTPTQDGRGAVWAAAIGSYARHGSEGLHGGSRVNIYGGSIGAEHAVGEHHSLGVALGSTHSMVERTAMSRLRQNATHFALYGNSRLNGKLSADWVAAIGAADMHGRVGADTAEWEQNSGALNARLNYTERLNERTALRAYAGAEYAATDADRVGGYKTGGVQTLRGEAGVAVTHSRENAQFYAELGLVNDLLRNNPTVDCGSYRSHGANLGRTGLKASVGGSVQLNESWSANAAYSIESAADATQQSINVGVSRKF